MKWMQKIDKISVKKHNEYMKFFETMRDLLIDNLIEKKADLKESQNNFADPYVQKLQEFIVDVKKSREMEARFMILEEMLRDERNAGKTEGVKYTLLETINAYGEIPSELQEKIEKETDLEVLKSWFQTALRAGSVEAFEEVIQSR